MLTGCLPVNSFFKLMTALSVCKGSIKRIIKPRQKVEVLFLLVLNDVLGSFDMCGFIMLQIVDVLKRKF